MAPIELRSARSSCLHLWGNHPHALPAVLPLCGSRGAQGITLWAVAFDHMASAHRARRPEG